MVQSERVAVDRSVRLALSEADAAEVADLFAALPEDRAAVMIVAEAGEQFTM